MRTYRITAMYTVKEKLNTRRSLTLIHCSRVAKVISRSQTTTRNYLQYTSLLADTVKKVIQIQLQLIFNNS